MLKSISYMLRLQKDLLSNVEQELISNFFIEIGINQNIKVYLVSDVVDTSSELTLTSFEVGELSNKKVEYIFLSERKAQEEDYQYLFEGDKVSYGLRRSLGALLEKDNIKDTKENVVTFFSYKGGVGRTTSLALTATYLSRQGKKVFVIDCDFEAPGLINFFNSSQAENCKNGLVEYLNDRSFIENCNIEDYVFNIEKTYSGDGVINLMPAGNILHSNQHLISYLEGLAKIDMQGQRLVSILSSLISDINNVYNPDVILIDSRTGFNNTFGALTQISKTVVVLAGDDVQNQPGVEYVTRALNEMSVNACFILSIISGNFNKRYNNFINQIKGLYSFDAEVFYFDRQTTLEHIGTSLEDKDDLSDFINGENGSTQYQKFFKYIGDVTAQFKSTLSIEESEIKSVFNEGDGVEFPLKYIKSELAPVACVDAGNDSIPDLIFNDIKIFLPDLYAENIDYSDEYIKNNFYFRQCMEDFLIPEKSILLGDKGTGKTAFYKALQFGSFFESLKSKAQKNHLNYLVLNVTNFDADNFEFLGFDKFIKDELFVKRFWMFFIWNAICLRSDYGGDNKEYLVELDKLNCHDKIIFRINDSSIFEKIEKELDQINSKLKSEDRRLIVVFDQLDNIVKPFLWDDVISPLIKIVMRFSYGSIHPKLFLRRDLYERLGNLTNKNAFSSRVIDLEWSQNEIFSFFLKIVFNCSKDNFLKFLEGRIRSLAFIDQVKRKLKTKDIVHNQLPLDTSLIQPIINVFFGDPKPSKSGVLSTAYEDLYRNIQSADKTVNLRPFMDLLINAIREQEEQDSEKKFRKNAILGLAYCTSKSVRKNAVVQYLSDLWNEQGNEFVKYFCLDISNNKVSEAFKVKVLDEYSFDRLLLEVKTNHSDDEAIKNGTLAEFKQVLIATKIVTPYMVGSKTRYNFAYLYTSYLGM